MSLCHIDSSSLFDYCLLHYHSFLYNILARMDTNRYRALVNIYMVPIYLTLHYIVISPCVVVHLEMMSLMILVLTLMSLNGDKWKKWKKLLAWLIQCGFLKMMSSPSLENICKQIHLRLYLKIYWRPNRFKSCWKHFQKKNIIRINFNSLD